MFSPQKIVVGVKMPNSRPWDAANLTATVRLAVRQAFDVAGAMSANVTMVCVLPEVSAGWFGSAAEAATNSDVQKSEALALLDDLATQYRERLGQTSEVESHVVFGKPWLEILKAVGASRGNMIVCGVRDQNAACRLLFGSTGQKLLRNAACPVWLVKPRIDDDADLDVLAATDLSEVGEDVLFAGVALGQSLPVRLNILHVLNNETELYLQQIGIPTDKLAANNHTMRTQAEDRLHDQLSLTDYRTVEKGVQVHVKEGATEGEILSAIKEMDIDLLIIATASRGGLPGMVLGNTAERLLPELPCSVLAIKPDDFKCPVPFDEEI